MSNNHLMHPRVANNHIDHGYFPTDAATLTAIAAHLDIAGDDVRIFDPCCGEGAALSFLSAHLVECGARCTSFGIELEADRAQMAKHCLDYALHGDIENSLFVAKAVGLLFLNPPYGFNTRDQLSVQRSKRLEEMFFDRTIGALQDNGVMVLIVPTTVLSESFTYEIASHFTELRVWKAAVDTYKQVVIMGIKPPRRASIGKKQTQIQQQMLLQWASAENMPTDPQIVYEVPAAPVKPFRPINHAVDVSGLADELQNPSQTLWPQFERHFSEKLIREKRRPLCALGRWHAALALAAGQVDGIVSDASGKQLLIKGSTHKTKVVSTSEEYDSKGNAVIVSTHLDRFVPCIRAIDLTINSDDYGRVLTIQ